MLVLTREVVDPERTVPLLRLAPRGTKPGIVDRNHGEQGLAPYRPIEQVTLPDPGAYLLLDVDRGEEFLGVRPEEARADRPAYEADLNIHPTGDAVTRTR